MNAKDAVWILDGGPFDTLACALEGTLSTNWPSDTFFVAEETRENADPDTYRDQLLKTNVWTTFEIEIMDNPAGEILYEHFRDQNTTNNEDLGEHQALTWILAEDRDAIFVSRDKLACYLALYELGRMRVAHPNQFWSHLERNNFISSNKFGDLIDRTHRQEKEGMPNNRPWCIERDEPERY